MSRRARPVRCPTGLLWLGAVTGSVLDGATEALSLDFTALRDRWPWVAQWELHSVLVARNASTANGLAQLTALVANGHDLGGDLVCGGNPPIPVQARLVLPTGWDGKLAASLINRTGAVAVFRASFAIGEHRER